MRTHMHAHARAPTTTLRHGKCTLCGLLALRCSSAAAGYQVFLQSKPPFPLRAGASAATGVAVTALAAAARRRAAGKGAVAATFFRGARSSARAVRLAGSAAPAARNREAAPAVVIFCTVAWSHVSGLGSTCACARTQARWRSTTRCRLVQAHSLSAPDATSIMRLMFHTTFTANERYLRAQRETHLAGFACAAASCLLQDCRI